MGWLLIRQDASGHRGPSSAIDSSRTLFLTRFNSGLLATPSVTDDEVDSVLGKITVQHWAVKLQAERGTLKIIPRQPRSAAAINPRSEEYVLQPKRDRHSEAIFIREGDLISAEGAESSLALAWEDAQVQVNSSVTASGEIPESEDQQVEAEATKSEEELAPDDTDDDDDLDRTVGPLEEAPSTSKVFRSTPLPSAARTEVVQETPTADRINGLVDMPPNLGARNETDAPPPEEAATTERTKESQEGSPRKLSSTPARSPSRRNGASGNTSDSEMANRDDQSPSLSAKRSSRRYPHVKIPPRGTKRGTPTPVPDEPDSSAPLRSTKRIKTHNEHREDDLAVGKTVRKTALKVKKRPIEDLPEPPEPPAPPAPPASSRSQRSSQCSAAADGEYNGPKPRVAFSNSSIPSTSGFIRFLKKHGGSVAESVTDGCNILCVKDGALSKTMKLLQSIALGIPIVTDKWLIDSTHATHLLPLESYIPHAPAQEAEWRFSLARIWGSPQKTLFAGYTVYFTPALKAGYRGFAEMEAVLKSAGARRVISKKAGGKDVAADETIVLAKEEEDADAAALMKEGKACFSKELLVHSILRGVVDLHSDEFVIAPQQPRPPPTAGRKKGRSRKS